MSAASHASRKVAVVTGASQGIGAGAAESFREAGYAVVGVSRSISPSDASDFLTVRGDIAEVETAEMIVDQAVNRFGRIDSLINNAGIFISKPFTDYTLEDYLAITAVNLTGFFHVTQAVIRQMLTQDSGGHIVNVTSSLVDHAESENPSALVSLTKGGLAAVTRSLAIEYASRGVRCNEVSLGVIQNPAPSIQRPMKASRSFIRWAESVRSATSSRESSISSEPHLSRELSCTSMVVSPRGPEFANWSSREN